jgi:predicted nucleotidyltransferase
VKHRREEIAAEVMERLSIQLPGAAVSLRGSLASGNVDEYSDIDIGVEDTTRTDQVAAASVIQCMHDSCDVVFYDWAKSLLPNECVITFFLGNLPLHWNIDIEITVPRSNRLLSSEAITYKQPDHLLKLWVIVGKHLVRNSIGHREEIDGLCRKILGADVTSKSSVQKMRCLLESLRSQAETAYPAFLDKCEAFMKRIEP